MHFALPIHPQLWLDEIHRERANFECFEPQHFPGGYASTSGAGKPSSAFLSTGTLPRFLWGEDPIEAAAELCNNQCMNILLVLVVLLLLFGGGGFYFGGPVIGGGGIGLILLICLLVYIFGGFRTRN